MITITIRNTYCYASKHFNALSKPTQNKIVKQCSYQRPSQHQKFRFNTEYLFKTNPLAADNTHYYQFPTGLLKLVVDLFKERGAEYQFIDERGRKPAQISSEQYFKHLERVDSKIEERDYQERAIKACLKRVRGIVSHSTGAGKTLVIAGVTFCLNCRTLILCIGKEHVNQMTRDMEKYVGRNVSVITGGRYDDEGPIVVSNIQALMAIKKKDEFGFRKLVKNFKCVIVDECFIPGTKISTPDGDKNIEDVKVGDKVIGFDEKTKQIINDEVTNIFKNEIQDKLYHVKINGEITTCTANHPFYTNRGWVKASELKKRIDAVWCVSNHRQEKKEKILNWFRVENIEAQEQRGIKESRRLCGSSCVYNLETKQTHTYIANSCVVHNCHHNSRNNSWNTIIYHAVNAIHKYGFSGTVYREDGSELEMLGAIGPVIDEVGYDELTENNHICQARFLIMDPMCDPLYDEDDMWPNCLKLGITENEIRNQWISRICQIYAAKKMQILVICPFRKKHVESLAEMIPGSKLVYGDSQDMYRKDILEEFGSKKFYTLITTRIYDEVINLPDVKAVLFAGGGKAHNATYQRIGRGIRKAPGKEYVDIIIPWDSHSSILLKHSKTVLGLIKKVKVWRDHIKFVGNYRKHA